MFLRQVQHLAQLEIKYLFFIFQIGWSIRASQAERKPSEAVSQFYNQFLSDLEAEN